MAAATFEIDDNLFSRLKDKVVIVTGGSTGIGRGTASLFAAHGAIVTVADLNATESPIPGTSFAELDVTSWAALAKLFRDVYDKHGRVDVVFANAGVAVSDNYLDLKVDENTGEVLQPSHRTLEINLRACVNTVALAVHYMKKGKNVANGADGEGEGKGGGGEGSIIVTASASSYQRFIASDYTTAKHGVLGLMRSLVDQLLPLGIRINAIAPSWTDTRLVPKAAVERIGVVVQSVDVVARSVALLAVDKGRTGQTVYSSAGIYREVEGPVLKVTREILAEDVDEGEAALRMLKLGDLDLGGGK